MHQSQLTVGESRNFNPQSSLERGGGAKDGAGVNNVDRLFGLLNLL